MLLMFLAGFETLPKAPFEAARVDGAGVWLIFWHVTLPMSRPVIVVALIIRALDAFEVFEYVFAITRGGRATRQKPTCTLSTKPDFGFFRMGEAAAAFVLILVTMVLVIALVFATKSNKVPD